MSHLDQLADGADNSVGVDAGSVRQPQAGRVYPDAVNAERLRGADVPLQVVADRPGLCPISVQRLEERFVDRGLRLAEAELAFNNDVIEVRSEREALDLRPLAGAAAVRRHSQRDAAGAKVVERLQRAGAQA